MIRFRKLSFVSFQKATLCNYFINFVEKNSGIIFNTEQALNNINKLIVVGDKILIKPQEESGKTTTGLYLPPGVKEKENIQSGYVIKAGPGYAIGLPADDEPWKEQKEKVKYIPLQVNEGDLAIFLKKDAYEIEYDHEKYFIVSQAAILLLIRDELAE
ncbi:MAG: co-chaperone GroES family protein [Ignavibacteriaceae bacterium]|jgi:co-chaperonin GroES (HSP10)